MTSRIFKVLANLSFREAAILAYGLVLDSFYKRLPANTFHVKNSYDKIMQRGGTFRKVGDDTRVELNSTVFLLRRKGSDFSVFNQIILQNELEAVVSEAIAIKGEPFRIFDCGANIGMSVVYFKVRFPESQIIAVEPNESNYRQLCKNIEVNSFTEVTPLNIGVWYESDMLAADTSFRDRADWSFSLSKAESGNGSYKVDSISNIIRSNQWESLDVLKIDIEGAEFDLFRNLTGWQTVLDQVKIISIEIHEERGHPAEIEDILKANGFTIKRSGELTIGVRNDRMRQ